MLAALRPEGGLLSSTRIASRAGNARQLRQHPAEDAAPPPARLSRSPDAPRAVGFAVSSWRRDVEPSAGLPKNAVSTAEGTTSHVRRHHRSGAARAVPSRGSRRRRSRSRWATCTSRCRRRRSRPRSSLRLTLVPIWPNDARLLRSPMRPRLAGRSMALFFARMAQNANLRCKTREERGRRCGDRPGRAAMAASQGCAAS